MSEPAPKPEPAPKSEPTAKSESESRLVTRILAFLVIAVGLGLVAYVFLEAKHLFEAPELKLPVPTPTPKPSPGAPPNASNALGETVVRGVLVPTVDFTRRLLALLVMCIAGSLIAALGIRWWGKR